jgi:hypothetical protein
VKEVPRVRRFGMVFLYIAARLVAFSLIFLVFVAQGIGRARAGHRGGAVSSFASAFVFLLLSGLLAII